MDNKIKGIATDISRSDHIHDVYGVPASMGETTKVLHFDHYIDSTVTIEAFKSIASIVNLSSTEIYAWSIGALSGADVSVYINYTLSGKYRR